MTSSGDPDGLEPLRRARQALKREKAAEREFQVEITVHEQGAVFVVAESYVEAELKARDGDWEEFFSSGEVRIGVRHMRLATPPPPPRPSGRSIVDRKPPDRRR